MRMSNFDFPKSTLNRASFYYFFLTIRILKRKAFNWLASVYDSCFWTRTWRLKSSWACSSPARIYLPGLGDSERESQRQGPQGHPGLNHWPGGPTGLSIQSSHGYGKKAQNKMNNWRMYRRGSPEEARCKLPESKPSPGTTEAPDSSSNMRQHVWKAIYQGSSPGTRCAGFLDGADHVGTFCWAPPKSQTRRRKAGCQQKPYCFA